MTPNEEYENFMGVQSNEDGDLCRRCHDWPCRCVRDERLDEVDGAEVPE